MATRKLDIKTKITGAPKVLRSIKEIDDAIRTTEGAARDASTAMGEMKISPEVLRSMKSLTEGLDDFIEAARRAQTTARDTGESGAKSFTKMQAAIITANAAMGLLTGGFKLAKAGLKAIAFPVGLAVDFEYGVAKIKAIANGIPESFGDAMAELAARLPQSQADLIAGAESVARAGLQGDKIVPLLESASKLATAAGSTLEESASLIMTGANVWKMYGLTTDEVADKLFQATRLGKTSIEELNESLGRSAAVAAQYGTSLDDVLAITTTLAAQGVATAESQTIVNSLIKGLSKPTKQAAEAFKRYGIEVGASELASTGLIAKLEQIHSAVGQDKDALSGLFGRFEATRGIMGLFSGDLTGLRTNLDAIGSSTGAVDDAWGGMMNTTKGLFQQLNALKESVLLELGNAVLPLVKRGLAGISEWYAANGEAAINGLVNGIGSIGEAWESNALLIAEGVSTMATAAADLARDTKYLLDALGVIDVVAQERHNAERSFAQGMDSIHSRAMERQAESITAIQQLMAERRKLGEGMAAVEARAIIDREKEIIATERKAALDRKIAALDAARHQAWLKFNEARAKLDKATVEKYRERFLIARETQRGIVDGYRAEIEALKDMKGELDNVTSASYQRATAAVSSFSLSFTEGIGSAGAALDDFNRRAAAVAASAEKERADRVTKLGRANDAARAEAEKKAKDAAKAAEVLGKKRAAAALQAEEDLLYGIADMQDRAWAQMLLKQKRARAELVQVTKEGSDELYALDVKQAAIRSEFEEAENQKKLRALQKRLKTEFKARDKLAEAARKQRLKANEAVLKSQKDLDEDMSRMTKQLGVDLAHAGIMALLFESSFKKAFNGIAEALAGLALTKALWEVAEAIAAAARYDFVSAGVHAKAAAAYGAIAVVSGVAAAATSGGGGSSSGGGAAPSAASGSSTPSPRERDTTPDGGGAQVINVNFGGTMPLATANDIGKAVASALDDYSRTRGLRRVNTAGFAR